MDGRAVGPWIPPAEPALGRLALMAADAEGLAKVGAWPELRGNGVAFAGLPTFLCWRGEEAGRQHLALLQARELGALQPGARVEPLPADWLARLDLEALARPLRIHPDFPGGASVHVLQVHGPGAARVRSAGGDAPALLSAMLERLTGIRGWRISAAPQP